MSDAPFARPTLHPYQQQAVSEVLEALRQDQRVVLQMPTASGKTFTAIEIVRALRKRGPVWFVCHRQEIIRQTVAAFNSHNIDCGVIAPWADPDLECAVQVASMQSLAARLDRYQTPATIVWDECQHAAAKTWAALFDRFDSAWHLGLTATPERLDGKPLSALFRRMVCGPSTRSLIEQGYLSPFKIFTQCSEDRDAALIALRSSKGDYRADDLSRVMNTPIIIGDAVEHYNRHTPGKRALAFTASVEASKALVERFLAQGTPALHVDADTSDAERKAAVEALQGGHLKVISNVEVFTEGTDVPALDAVILLRPTRSLALYLQMVGRALRRCEGKELAVILDHAGFFWQQPGPSDEYEWSLEGGARRKRLVRALEGKERHLICPCCGLLQRHAAICESCGAEFDEESTKPFVFDGHLGEVTPAGVAGLESAQKFADRVGTRSSSIYRHIKKGMPTVDGLIPIEQALAWLKENPQADIRPIGSEEGEYELAADLAKSAGLPKRQLSYLIHTGRLPSYSQRWVRVDEFKEVLASDFSRNLPPSNVENPDEYEPRRDFFKRIGLSMTQKSPFWDDLKLASNGWVHWPSGVELARSGGKVKKKPSSGLVRKIDFCKSQNLFPSALSLLIRRGLPVEGDFVREEVAIKWIKENYRRRE